LVLLTVGKYVMTLYFAHTAIGSLYGAAGSLAIILVWVYFNSHVVFFGAELAYAYVKLFRPGTREIPQADILDGSHSDTLLQ
jgi:membrane protein